MLTDKLFDYFITQTLLGFRQMNHSFSNSIRCFSINLGDGVAFILLRKLGSICYKLFEVLNQDPKHKNEAEQCHETSNHVCGIPDIVNITENAPKAVNVLDIRVILGEGGCNRRLDKCT